MNAVWDWLTTNGVGQNVLASLIWAPVAFLASHALTWRHMRKEHTKLRAEMKQQHELTRRKLADAAGGDEPAPAPLREP